MKKKLIILVLLFVSTKIWGAKGVDCTNIKAPDLSEFGFQLYDKVVYEKKHLGASLHYQLRTKGQVIPHDHLLSYYSYDLNFEVIDQKILDLMLSTGVKNIQDKYSQENGEYILQDDARYYDVRRFNDWGMQKFINQGVFITATHKKFMTTMKKIEIVTVGTDGYCIHKVRWTSSLFEPKNDWKNTFGEAIKIFEESLNDFFRLLSK